MRLFTALMVWTVCLIVTSSPPEKRRNGGLSALPRATLLRGLFAGQRHLIADYFWLLTINRIGAARTLSQYRDVYYYADLATDLDPDFEMAYSFSALNIPAQEKNGTYVNLREAEQLLRKGLKQFPNSRKMLFQLAFNYMFYEGEYQKAADIFHTLAQDPTAPPWYGILATRLYAAGGDLETSAYLTQRLLESCIDPESCESYERRLVEIEQERLLREIDAAAARFEADYQRRPQDVAELKSAGMLSGLPPDPFDGDYFIDTDGKARSTATKHRLELIRENKKWSPPGSPSAP